MESCSHPPSRRRDSDGSSGGCRSVCVSGSGSGLQLAVVVFSRTIGLSDTVIPADMNPRRPEPRSLSTAAAVVAVGIMALSMTTRCGTAAVKVEAVFGIGDSYLDGGNNKYIAGSLFSATFPPYGLDYIPNSGRFTNGKTLLDVIGGWCDVMCEREQSNNVALAKSRLRKITHAFPSIHVSCYPVCLHNPSLSLQLTSAP